MSPTNLFFGSFFLIASFLGCAPDPGPGDWICVSSAVTDVDGDIIVMVTWFEYPDQKKVIETGILLLDKRGKTATGNSMVQKTSGYFLDLTLQDAPSMDIQYALHFDGRLKQVTYNGITKVLVPGTVISGK